MDAVKNEMPIELLETHEYLMGGALGGRLYRTDPKLKALDKALNKSKLPDKPKFEDADNLLMRIIKEFN